VGDSLFGGGGGGTKSSSSLERDKKKNNEVDFAPPRLDLMHRDTGLETLFGSVFSLDDEPREVASGRPSREASSLGWRKERRTSWMGAAFWTVVIAGVCSVAVSFWMMGRLW